MSVWSPWIAAVIGAPLIALGAWRARALTASGAIAASLIGIGCLGGGGWLGGASLLVFFGTSTVLSRVGKRKKEALGYEKGGRRDAAQALANGGVAALCGLIAAIVPNSQTPLLAAMLGALAAANADTWATELGSLFGGTPRKITDFKPARVGESGAVSTVGSVAGMAGAAIVAAVALLFDHSRHFALPVLLGGSFGMLIDSYLGATIQVQYQGDTAGRLTEQRCFADGAERTRVRGVSWIGNDMVNTLATIAGAVIAGLLAGR